MSCSFSTVTRYTHSRMARVGVSRVLGHLYYPALVVFTLYMIYLHVGTPEHRLHTLHRQLSSTPQPRYGYTARPHLIFDSPVVQFYLRPRLDLKQQGLRPLLVVLVCSSPANRKLRDAARSTWADHVRTDIIRSGVVKIFFVVGSVDDG